MFKIEKITIKNFGPYYGEQTIKLPEEKGICLIWGDNGVGKTSIINSFRYVLWGKIYNRKKEIKQPCEFVNYKAREMSEDMLIEISIVYNGEKYLLSRGLKRVSGDGTRMENYEPICQIIKGVSIMSPNDRDHFLSTALPEKISRFYLFDGELLSEYEDLLDDKDLSGEKIKQSIEAILGIPILENASNTLFGLHNKYAKSADKLSKDDERTREISEVLIGMRKLDEELTKERDSQKQELEKLQEEEGVLKERLSNSAKYREILGQRDQIIDFIKITESTIKDEIEKVQPLMDDAWKSIMNKVIADKIDSEIKIITSIEEKRKNTQISTTISNYLKKILEAEDHSCPSCGTTLTEKSKCFIVEQISSLKNTSIESNEEDIILNKARRNSDFLKEQISESTKIDASKLLKSIQGNKGVLDTQKVKLFKINDEIKNISTEESEENARTLVDKISKCSENAVILKMGLETQDKRIKEARENIDKLEKRRAKVTVSESVSDAVSKAEFIKRISNLFKDGICSFREKLKNDVEHDASTLFSKIAHNPQYKSLSINDNYGLQIVTENGVIVPNRSSGYEQVVAISLISSLHRNAPITGPIFMDSTFQRIDPKHKYNIIKILPELGEQVIVLAFEGEINKQDTRETLNYHLKKEFTLNQIDPFETTIKG